MMHARPNQTSLACTLLKPIHAVHAGRNGCRLPYSLMVRSQQRQYISFWCGSLKTAQIKRRVRAEPDVTVKMALGKRERRSVAHQQRKCAVLANGLGHFPDPQIVLIVKGLGKLNERPTGDRKSLVEGEEV